MDFIKLVENSSWCSQDWDYLKTDEETLKLLQQCTDFSLPENIQDSVEKLIEKSRTFTVPFPIDSTRLIKLKETRSEEQLQKNIKSTYPLIHSRVLVLIARFLVYKRKYGTAIEKELYKNMSIPEFIDRLLLKRAAVFIGSRDRYKLLNGKSGVDGWESIGKSEEVSPLTLDSCLSYDEMKISSFLYVSGHTECINDGNRQNAGKPSDDVQATARIIGLIGPRFKRKNRMDYEDAIISKDQNCPNNGYEKGEDKSVWKQLWTQMTKKDHQDRVMWRKLWAEFYQIPVHTYEEVIEKVTESNLTEEQNYTNRFVPIKDKVYIQSVVFDNEVYYKRLRILAECALLEADSVAADEGTSAYLYIVGCGLGVWRISNHQNDVYFLTFLETIKNLLEAGSIQHVSDVNFAYISYNSVILNNEEKELFLENKNHPNGGIKVTVKNSEPSSPLTGPHSHKLLVMTYPWDSNAHPGNEFWLGQLRSSGDPAAACSTQVAELHNAHINPRVSGYNVRVADTYGIKKMSTYCAKYNNA